MAYSRQWKKRKPLWFNYKARISGDMAGEVVTDRTLELYPKTRRTHWIILGKETTWSNLCFRKPTRLLPGKWTEPHPTIAGQMQIKALGSPRAPVVTTAKRKSAVILGQIPDATAPKLTQAQPLYGSSGCSASAWCSESWPLAQRLLHTEDKMLWSFCLSARKPTLWLSPHLLGLLGC